MRWIDGRVAEVEIPRPSQSEEPIDQVRAIIEEVRARGDDALLELTERFDGVRLSSLRVPADEIEAAAGQVEDEVRSAMEEAARRIEAFARHQSLVDWREESGGGVIGEVVTPVTSAGLYVPGGRATYPSSVLMSAVPARVAGVPNICLCVPPGPGGHVPVATLAAAKIAGVGDVFAVGGAQAIAAMAFGTTSIPKVDVIAGPGNIYVALAKREVSGHVAIDAIAGPSEIAIVSDDTADPRMLASDLVAQAEHGPGGSFLLITWSESLASSVSAALEEMLDKVRASQQLRESLDEGVVFVTVKDVRAAAAVVNRFAPEHLELTFEGAEQDASLFHNAGAIFIGPYSPVSLGDYLAGTNHILPTAGAAAWSSGLRTSHFQKCSAFVQHTKDSLRVAAPMIAAFAAVEGLPHHSHAVKARFEDDVAR